MGVVWLSSDTFWVDDPRVRKENRDERRRPPLPPPVPKDRREDRRRPPELAAAADDRRRFSPATAGGSSSPRGELAGCMVCAGFYLISISGSTTKSIAYRLVLGASDKLPTCQHLGTRGSCFMCGPSLFCCCPRKSITGHRTTAFFRSCAACANTYNSPRCRSAACCAPAEMLCSFLENKLKET